MAFKHSHARYRPMVLQTDPDKYLHKLLAANLDEAESVFPEPVIERWRRQVGKFPNQPRAALQYPSANGWNDALTIMCVLDCLLRIETTSYINAGGLFALLQEEYPQIVWDPITVGRILGHLTRAAANCPAANDNEPIIGTVNYGGAKHYVIGPDIHSWNWLGMARELMGREAVHAIRATLRGKRPKNMPYWEQIESLERGNTVESVK